MPYPDKTGHLIGQTLGKSWRRGASQPLIFRNTQAVPQTLGHRAIPLFLENEIEVEKAHGSEIGMGATETGRTVGGEQISAAFVAGEGRIFLLPVDKKNTGVLRIFMLAVGAGKTGKLPGMAAICTLQPALSFVPKDSQMGKTTADRAITFVPRMGGKLRLQIPGFFRQHETIKNAEKEVERYRRNPKFCRLIGELSIGLFAVDKEQGEAIVLPFGKSK